MIIKKRNRNKQEIPDTSTQIKSEPVTAKVEEPVIENNELLSLKKVDASGNLIVNKEKQKEEKPSCNDDGNNLLDQLKLVLNAQSAQVQRQTDLILKRSEDLHDFVLTKADNTDTIMASISEKKWSCAQ